MSDPMWGENREEPTTAEAEFTGFLDRLSRLRIYYGFWQDDQGPWMLAILNFNRDINGRNVIRKTLRLDFNPAGICGGWSRYNLDGDAGFRAEHAGVDTAPPDGISLSAADCTIEELARAAADWFQRHWDDWEKERHLPPT